MSGPRYWKLNPDHSVEACDLMTWATQFEHVNQRVLQQDFIGGFWISTIFIGLHHGVFTEPDKSLQLFETMVFDENMQETETYRSATWNQAMAIHLMTLAQIQSSMSPTQIFVGNLRRWLKMRPRKMRSYLVKQWGALRTYAAKLRALRP